MRIGVAIHRLGSLQPDEQQGFNIILTATLTLLSLILGFSFSMAITPYDQRKGYEEAEASAISTEYARAELLPTADAGHRSFRTRVEFVADALISAHPPLLPAPLSQMVQPRMRLFDST